MPTIKQKKAIQAVVENGGIVSKAMIDAGYSENTAKTPQKLTESDGWKELMKEYLPDKTLAKIHQEGLKATTKKPHLIDRDDKGRPIYDYVEEDDYSVRHKYLDTAYKLKGAYSTEDLDTKPKSNTTYNFIFNAETQAEIKELESKIKARLINPNA